MEFRYKKVIQSKAFDGSVKRAPNVPPSSRIISSVFNHSYWSMLMSAIFFEKNALKNK